MFPILHTREVVKPSKWRLGSHGELFRPIIFVQDKTTIANEVVR